LFQSFQLFQILQFIEFKQIITQKVEQLGVKRVVPDGGIGTTEEEK